MALPGVSQLEENVGCSNWIMCVGGLRGVAAAMEGRWLSRSSGLELCRRVSREGLKRPRGLATKGTVLRLDGRREGGVVC